MKNIHTAGREQRRNSLFSHSLFFPLVISVFCLSLFTFSACQTQTKKSSENAPPARPETVSNLPPKVTRIDEQGLRDLLKPNGKPRLINFWATWCGPCREEFPDLVKIG